MELAYLLALVVGLLCGLLFGAGAFIGHAVEMRITRKHIDSIVTAEDHRNEAALLLHLALRQRDDRYAAYLKNQAMAHCLRADILENGPYRDRVADVPVKR